MQSIFRTVFELRYDKGENKWPILTNEDHTFYIYNIELKEHIEYKPTSRRKKAFAVKCELVTADGVIRTFPSIQEAAIYIGRGPETLRVWIRDGKPVKDSQGIVIQVRRSDEKF